MQIKVTDTRMTKRMQTIVDILLALVVGLGIITLSVAFAYWMATEGLEMFNK